MCLSWLGFFSLFPQSFLFCLSLSCWDCSSHGNAPLRSHSRKPSLTRAVSWQTTASMISESTAVFELRTLSSGNSSQLPSTVGGFTTGTFQPSRVSPSGQLSLWSSGWDSASHHRLKCILPSPHFFSEVSPTSQSEDFPSALPTINFVHF